MSSSDYEFEDDLADLPLETLDAAEAVAIAQTQTRTSAPSNSTNNANISSEVDYDDEFTFAFDEADLQQLDKAIEDRYAGKQPTPVAGPSRTRQTTLTGEVVDTPEQTSTQLRFQTRKTKVWDQTAYAASGKLRKKAKGKKKAGEEDSADEADVPLEFEQFPDEEESIDESPKYVYIVGRFGLMIRPIQPMKLEPDLEAGKEYLYPLNKPKRDYQYNIVKKCLFDNTLVSLPTGLGKTFIAGVVMLNYYRWFPEGKIIFMAPTKPLVAQQIEACHESSGIPGKDAVQITGETARDKRSRTWNLKRVFFATPQTVANDLMNDLCDARDIALLVIDEAHRGGGDSAYAQVVRIIMRRNPYFRILALTATPASTPDAVQGIVDSLHISNIETRLEESIDIQRYLHKKDIKTHIIEMSPEVKAIQEPLLKLIESLRNKAKSALYKVHKPSISVHPYAIFSTLREMAAAKNFGQYSTVHQLWRCVVALGHLMEVSIGKCYSYFEAIQKGVEPEDGKKMDNKKAARDRSLLQNPLLKDVLKALEAQKVKGFSHPKMDQMRNLLVQYFGAHDEVENPTKAMIFTTLRECVDDIVENLQDMHPLIRVSRFVGQSTDTKGKKGMAQKEQQQTIKDFKSGVYNVLVATSIGEEGLDIGEVDFIICYDAQKAPIKMLQRIGRTGRKRNGFVHVLLSEHREEMNFEQAKVTHKEIQKMMQNGTVELYADVARMLPDHIKPTPNEKVMEVKPYCHEQEFILRDDGSPIRGTKRKRKEVPEGAVNGFVKASQLKPKAKKQRKLIEKDFDKAGEDDSDDMDIEAGIVRRSASMAPLTTKSAAKSKTKTAGLRKTKTQVDPSTKTAKRPRKKKGKEPDPELVAEVDENEKTFSQKGVDDDDDMDIESGLIKRVCRRSSSPEIVTVPFKGKRKQSPAPIDISSSPEHPLNSASRPHSRSSRTKSSSPEAAIETKRLPGRPIAIAVCSPPKPKSPPPARNPTPTRDADMAWLLGSDDDNVDILILSSSPAPDPQPGPSKLPKCRSISQDENSILVIGSSSPVKPKSRPMRRVPSEQMPPPELVPNHSSLPSSSPLIPDFTQPVIKKRGKRKNFDVSGDLSSPLMQQPLNRLRRPRSPSPALAEGNDEGGEVTTSPNIPRHQRQLKQPKQKLQFHSDLILGEAVHSGDEVSEGSSHPSDDEEDEEDREFLHELPGTQLSDSYDQSLIYRESLLSQALPGFGRRGPEFGNGPIRRGKFGVRRGWQSGGPPVGMHTSSSPPREEEPDEYAFGSFVVDDDAEIIYSDS